MSRSGRRLLAESDTAEIIATANALADVARAATLPLFRSSDLVADNKVAAGFDPVTVADRGCEAAMRVILAERRPNDAILGEELGTTSGNSGLTWVLDPIDGTRAYLSGAPTWGVLIALADATGPRFGIIDQPYIGERFAGGFGRAELNGPHGRKPLATRSTRRLADAILFSTYPEVGSLVEGEAFQHLASRVRLTRYGLDCYAYALIALGQIDLVVEAELHPFDVHAPIAVIEAAGGLVTNWKGGPAHMGGRLLAAANPAIHAGALAILSQAPDA